MRRLLLISLGAAVLAAPAVRPAFAVGQKLDVSFNRYSGDYGTTDETTVTSIPFRWTWLFNKADVALTVPWVSIKGQGAVTYVGGNPVRGRPARARSGETTESGLGDIVVRGRATWAEESVGRPEIAPYAFLKFPTADEDDGVGTGEFDEGFGVELFKTLKGPYFGFLDLGYTFVGDPPHLDYNNQWIISFGGGKRITSELTLSAAYTEERNLVPSEDHPRDLTFTGQLQPRTDLSFFVSFLLGLSDGSPDTGFSVGGGWKFR